MLPGMMPLVVSTALRIEYLIVGGGSGGGAFHSGVRWGNGGNGGQVIAGSAVIAPRTLAVVVGPGGAGATGNSGAFGAVGTASSFNGVTANGGTQNTNTSGSASTAAGSGDGGANASGAEKFGGVGEASSISGSSVKYGGGGTMGNPAVTPPADYGVLYGGGYTKENGPVSAPVANSGGGGGGGQNQADGGSRVYAGQNGAAGVVIVRYPGAQRATGGAVTSSGGYTIHTFTSSGSLTF